MFYHINEIIDINLKLLFKSKNQSLKFSEFKNKEGKKLGKIMDFFELMEKENLIVIDNNRCNLTEFGKKIVEDGGWFKHLEEKQKKRENQKTKPDENTENKQLKKSKKKAKPFYIAKNSFSLLTHHFKKILKKKKI